MGRMRPHHLIALIVLLAFAAAGCGGNQISADEVSANPPVLPLPEGGTTASSSLRENAGNDDADEGDEDADADPDADATATPTAEAGAGTPAPPAATATPAPTTGGAAPQQDPEATGGAQADEGLDQFCADNPGAC